MNSFSCRKQADSSGEANEWDEEQKMSTTLKLLLISHARV